MDQLAQVARVTWKWLVTRPDMKYDNAGVGKLMMSQPLPTSSNNTAVGEHELSKPLPASYKSCSRVY